MPRRLKGPVHERGICRACGAMKRCRVLNAQYEFEGRPEVYSDIFLDCFGLLLSNLDGDNCSICATCVYRLRNAHSFKQQVLAQEQKLYCNISHMELDGEILKDMKFEISIKCEETTSDLLNEDVAENDYVKLELDVDTKSCIDAKMNLNEDTSNEIKKDTSSNTQRTIETDVDLKEELLRDMQITKDMIRKLEIAEENAQSKEIMKRQPPDIIQHNQPPDDIRMLQLAILEAKASKNVETLVEYSYVCPFENIFSDLICVYCKEVFSVPEELFLHTHQHDPLTFKDKRNKKKTTLIDITRIDCRLCDATIDNINQFKAHITSVHKKVYHPVKDAFISFKLKHNSLQCLDCESVFNFFIVLKRHMADHYGNHLCDLCGMHFFSKAQLKRHLERKHTSKPCKCSQCGLICKNLEYLKGHIHKAHKKDKIFECGLCHLKFRTFTEKCRHFSAVHAKGRTFKCTKCDGTFKDICAWREHKRLHARNLKIQQTRALSREDSLICPHCPKICLNKQGLRMHVKKIHEH